MICHRPIIVDIDQARVAIDQAEENMVHAVAVIMRKQDLLRRAYKAMLRVTINRVTADEWEAVDSGLMAELKKEANL